MRPQIITCKLILMVVVFLGGINGVKGDAMAAPGIMAGGLVSYPVPVISNNLLTNSSFEQINILTNLPDSWRSSKAFSTEKFVSKTGSGSVKMQDAPLYPYSESASQILFLKKGTYRIGGWVKLDHLGEANKGVRISLVGQGSTPIVYGTSDWQYLTSEKIAVSQDGNYQFKLEAYNEPSGTAWFDDVELRREGLPVESFLLYPNYRGMLFDDQSQVIRLDVNVDPLNGTSLQEYTVENSIEDESDNTLIMIDRRIAEAHFVYSFDGTQLKNGKTYLLKTRLLDTGNNTLVYEYPPYRISKMSGVLRSDMTVAFDENNRFLVNGKPTFWIGVYDSGMGYPASEALWESQLTSLRRLFELPINLYNNYWYGNISLESVQLLMNVLRKHGILYLQTGNAFANSYNDNYFKIDTDDTFLSSISNNPGLAGFYTVDEAIAGLAPTMFKQYDRLRTFKPDGVTFGVLLSPKVLSSWRDTIDMIATDPYPLAGAEPAAGYPLNMVGDYAAATRDAVQGSRPFVTVLQFFKLTSKGRWPTRDELRNMSYMAITEGSNGVLYWSLGANALAYVCTGWCDEKVAHFEDLKVVMNELKSLEPALTGIDQPTLLVGNTNPDAIHTRVKYVNGKGYLITYNYSSNPATATFTWADSLASVSVFNEARSLPTMDGVSFTDSYAPYQAHVYEICPAPVGNGFSACLIEGYISSP